MESVGNQHLLAQQAIGQQDSASVARKNLQVFGPFFWGCTPTTLSATIKRPTQLRGGCPTASVTLNSSLDLLGGG